MRVEIKVLAAVMAGLVLAGGILIVRKIHRPATGSERRIAVTIEGMVRRPGTYYVPAGTTRFEVLRVAGVQPNSDLNPIDVTQPLERNDTLNVGKLDKNVALRSPLFAGKACQVNFFVGETDIVGKITKRKPEKDAPVLEGERILTGPNGTLEIKLVDESLVDVRKNGELLLQELYKATETGALRVHLALNRGSLWSYVKPQSPNISLVFSTPHLTAEIRGTEFELSVTERGSLLRVVKGMVNAGRTGSDNRVSVSEGQQAFVDTSIEKNIEVRNLSEEDLAMDAERKSLEEEKSKFQAENAVLRQLILIQPDFYLLQEIDPSKPAISVYRIAPNTDVSEFVEGVNELSKVYLYGGMRLTMSIVERLTRKRVEYYTVLGKDNVLDQVNRMGGVFMNVDEKSAAFMHIKPGLAKLDGKLALEYIKACKIDDPAVSFRDRFIERQNRILKAVFENMISDKIVLTKLLAGQLMKGLETNITIDYALNAYGTLKATQNWRIDFENQSHFQSEP